MESNTNYGDRSEFTKPKAKKANTYLCLLLHLLNPPINRQIPFLSLSKKKDCTLIHLGLESKITSYAFTHKSGEYIADLTLQTSLSHTHIHVNTCQ